MTVDHPNAKLAKTAWAAVSAGDVDALSRICTPDVTWCASGRSPLSGEHRGQKAVFDYLARVGEAADRFDSHFDRVLVGDDCAAVVLHAVGRRGSKTLETDYVLIFGIRDGLIAEVWSVARDQYAVDAFWS